MSPFQALVLGAVQGLTEFLPISSSGHLIIFPNLFGWDIQSLAFDTILHLGTMLALIVYFWSDLWNIILRDRKLGLYLIVGSIPAGVAGFFLEDLVENTFRGVLYVALFLFIGTVMMFISERVGNWSKNKNIDIKIGFVVGIFQSLALFPGISRSGSTISGGMLLGLSREQAARFSFLLSIPIILGAGLFKVSKSFGGLSETSLSVLSAGFASSFVVGIFAIRFVLNYLKKRSLKIFIIYRLILILFLGMFLL